jgi:outer membrane protein assembly factor BamD (BamD/ComL family)
MPGGHHVSLTDVLYNLYEVRLIRQEKSGELTMKAFCTTLVLSLALLAGCTSGEKQAAELLETARFEEKQGNFEHASKLYDEILSKHPASPAAKAAAARMTEIKAKKP